MRADAYELENVRGGLAVDEYEVGLDVAIPMIFPFACEQMIAMLVGQRFVLRQHLHDADEIPRQCRSVLSLGLAFQVAFELRGLLNRPHQGPLGFRSR